MARVTEAEIALAVLQVAEGQPNGVASFRRLKKEIPDFVNLSDADRRKSQTRPNEQMWEQLIRNIKSHHDVPGNFICEGYLAHVPRVGYRITDAGVRLLRRRGL